MTVTVKVLRVFAVGVELVGIMILGSALFLSLSCDGCGYFTDPGPLLITGAGLITIGGVIMGKVKL